MKTFQSIAHARYPDALRVRQILRTESGTVAHSERQRRARLLIQVAAAVLALFTGSLLLRAILRTGWCAARVEAPTILVSAPASVRVTEVRCRSGERVSRSEILLVLEALEGREQRAAAAALVEERRARLELALAGGEVQVSDLGRRFDGAAEAEREVVRACSELRGAEAAHSALEARLEQARSLLLSSSAVAERASSHAERVRALQRDGIVSAQEADDAALDEEQSARERDAARASVSALEHELAAARERIDSAGEILSQWQAVLARRRERLPPAAGDPEALRELELTLLRHELAEAEARLRALAFEQGERIVRAECDGTIDALFVVPGSIAAAGEPLLSYHDPEKTLVVAYASPSEALEREPGETCRILLPGGDLEADGMVVAIDKQLVPDPGRERDEEEAEGRLSIRIRCLEPGLLLRVPLLAQARVHFPAPARRRIAVTP